MATCVGTAASDAASQLAYRSVAVAAAVDAAHVVAVLAVRSDSLTGPRMTWLKGHDPRTSEFTTPERTWNAEVTAALRAAGHEVFLPQENEPGKDAAGIFAADKAGIEWAAGLCEGFVAITANPATNRVSIAEVPSGVLSGKLGILGPFRAQRTHLSLLTQPRVAAALPAGRPGFGAGP